MLLKPINQIDKGKQDPYAQTYIGEVIDNNDPERLKRIKVSISLWDMLTDEQLQWVTPESSTSSSPDTDNHNIPEVGSSVKVSFNNNDPNEPVYTGAGVTESTKCSLFDEGYPNTYGQKDSIGNFTMHNKETGVSVFHHNSGTEVQIDPDGSFALMNKTGSYIACDKEGRIRCHGSSIDLIAEDELNLSATNIKMKSINGTTIEGTYIEVKASQELSCDAPETNMYGKICNFNNASVSIAHAFSVDSCGSWTYYDPFTKKYVEFVKGVLKTSLFIG